MDELWQRYRSFWRPVLLGLGVFLLGLIAVHILTPDPDVGEQRVAEARSKAQSLVQPSDGIAGELRADSTALSASVTRLAAALDAGASGRDPIAAAVEQTLRASFDADASEDGAREVERLAKLRTEAFRTGNPNVAFSALLSDVWGVLRTRANRADMDLDADLLGFAAVNSIQRPELRRRLQNLAVVARVTSTAIKSGGVSLDEVRFETPRPSPGPDAFLQEWPVTIVLTGSTACIEAVLHLLTDPQSPIPVAATLVQQPRRGKPGKGIVELTVTVDSVAVNPAASLNLESEEE